MQRRLSAPLVALAVLLALPGASQAQDRDVYKLPMPEGLSPMGAVLGRAVPGVAASSPIGYGPSSRDVFAGIGYQNSTGTDGDSDGAISVGTGFLDPNKIVGIEATITSVSTVRSGFGARMLGGVKVHKILANNWGVGVGVEGIRLNGDEFDTEESYYVAATNQFKLRDAALFNQATFNIGVGNGRFQSFDSFQQGDDNVGVFASTALRINYFSSAIIDYTGQQINAAMSFAPFQKLPAVVTASLNDLTGEAGDKARLALAVGFSWKY